MWFTGTKPPPWGLQLGEPGRHGGGSPPSAKAPTEHVPTSIAVARTSLIIRLTIFLQCAIRTGVSFNADGPLLAAKSKSVQCSGSQTEMRFRSAREDLYETTLRAFNGVLARIEYLAGLRQPSGRYEHWGMARVHGEPAVEAALQEAHVQTMNAVLRKPLAELYE